MRVIVLIYLVVLGVQAQAGAWPREKGEGFLSFSTEYDDEDDALFTSLFVDYGITHRITAGLDLGFADEELYKAVAFARYPISQADADWNVALELGMGVTEDEAVLRPGLMLGRGLTLGRKSGWLSIEALAYYKVEQDDVDVSTDVTLGLNMTDRHKLLFQLQNGNQPMDPDYLNFASSVVIEQTPGFHVELGMKAGLKEDGDYAFKLGMWHHF